MKKTIAAALCALCMLWGIGAASSEATTLRLEGGNVGVPNPFRHTIRGPGIARMQILYDSLLEKDENGEIPWLAESWESNEDGTVYTFRLRENAFWHDGEPLTAEDVAFTFAYYRKHLPVYGRLSAGGEYIVADARALDARTVEMTLPRFDNTYLASVGSARILPKHIWEKVDDPTAYDGEGVAVGSGPYRLDRFDAKQGAYRYVAFERYWGPKPAAEAVEWVPVGDRTLAFEKGEIDLINAPVDLLPRYKNDPAFTIMTAHSLHSYRLMMNMEAVPALHDVAVRKAVAYALDREGLVKSVARGSATVSSMGYVPTESPWHNPEIERYARDPLRAKELLGGRSFSFSLLTDNTPEGTKAAELIKLSLAAVGIDAAVKSVEARTRDNAMRTGEYELLLVNFGGLGGDPDFIRALYGVEAGLVKGWSNAEMSELLNAQAAERDGDVRKAMVFRIQEILAEEVPVVMLFGMVDNFVYRSGKHDGWMCRYDHNKVDHNKLSYLIRKP